MTRAYEPCMSRHLDNVGKPRPPVAWVMTYSCPQRHSPGETRCCDRCATSLVDGLQRCASCYAPMIVRDLRSVDSGDSGPQS